MSFSSLPNPGARRLTVCHCGYRESRLCAVRSSQRRCLLLDTETRTNTVDRLLCLVQCPDAFLWCAKWRPLLCNWLMWLRDGWTLIGRLATIYTAGWRAHCWFGKQEARLPTLPVNHWARMRMALQPRLQGLRMRC